MLKKLLCFVLLSLWLNASIAQSNALRGRVIDEQSTTALAGVTVTVKGSVLSTVTNNEGYYFFPKIEVESFLLVFSAIGYETKEVPVSVSPGQNVLADVALAVVYKPGDVVVVTASKRPEKITDAPASIQVIGKKELEQFSGSNPFELLSRVQGVDYALINARGMNNAFNNKVLQIVDNRKAPRPLAAACPCKMVLP